MTPARAAAVLAHASRLDRLRVAMLDACAGIPQQLAAILDPSQLKAFICTRRAGKSWAIGILLFMTAVLFPGCSCLYLGLTKDSAIGTMNKDILRVLNDRFMLGAVWKESDRLWRFPNGSLVYLRGADANAYEISKVVGQKYRLAVLDEASKYRYNIHAMVYGSLLPAMGDDVGTIVLSGTPSNITAGLFFNVTKDGAGQHLGWSVHRWTWQDNVHKRDNIRQTHDKLVADNPLVTTTPLYKQEWLGLWVVDMSALVYKFDDALNTAAELPRPASEYMYMLGIDLGFTDPTALVVGAYHVHDPTLYLVQSIKEPGLIISNVVDLVRGLWLMPAMGCSGPYPFVKMVADAAALQSVEEMRQKYHLPIDSAEKAGKRGVIEVFNSDLQTGRIKLLPAAMSIATEWGALIWDEKKLAAMPKRWEEDPRFDNHESDASLYLWRAARNHNAVDAPKQVPAIDSPEYGNHMLEQIIARRALAQQAGWPRQVQVDRGQRGPAPRLGRPR